MNEIYVTDYETAENERVLGQVVDLQSEVAMELVKAARPTLELGEVIAAREVGGSGNADTIWGGTANGWMGLAEFHELYELHQQPPVG